jgi:MFS family permease
VSYYFAKVLNSIGIKSQERQTLINGILTIVNYITALIAVFFVSKVGRRTMFICSTLGMLFSFAAFTACIAVYNEGGQKNKAAANAALGLVFIFYTFFNAGFNPLLYLYPVSPTINHSNRLILMLTIN